MAMHDGDECISNSLSHLKIRERKFGRGAVEVERRGEGEKMGKRLNINIKSSLVFSQEISGCC